MVDKLAKIDYTNSVEVNKAITCGDFLFSHLLSHYSQFNPFGGRTPGFTFHTRETPALRFLASTTESDVESGAFSFYQKQTALREGANFPQSLAHNERGTFTVALQDFNLSPLPDANSGDPDSNLSSLPIEEQIAQTQAQVNAIGAIVDEAIAQMYKAMKRLEKLQEAAELGAFYGFIQSELEMEL